MSLLPPTWGDVVSVIVFLVTLHMYHTRNVARFAKLELKVGLMWSQLKSRLNIHTDDEDENGEG